MEFKGKIESVNTPASNFTGQNNKLVAVNSTGTALQYVSTVSSSNLNVDSTVFVKNLTNVENTVQKAFAKLDGLALVYSSSMGVAYGVATLDLNAKIPLAQLSDSILGQIGRAHV